MDKRWVGPACIGVALCVCCGRAMADDSPLLRHSVAPKAVVFFPNGDSEGLKDFSTGFGGGLEARFTVAREPNLAVQVGPEIDYIGLSALDQTVEISGGYPINETIKFSTLKVSGNIFLLIPTEVISVFFGGGLVYTDAKFDGTLSSYGNSMSFTGSGSGVGGQFIFGLDVKAGTRGAFTIDFTVPISQKHSVTLSSSAGSGSSDLNLGGTELVFGYRIYF